MICTSVSETAGHGGNQRPYYDSDFRGRRVAGANAAVARRFLWCKRQDANSRSWNRSKRAGKG